MEIAKHLTEIGAKYNVLIIGQVLAATDHHEVEDDVRSEVRWEA